MIRYIFVVLCNSSVKLVTWYNLVLLSLTGLEIWRLAVLAYYGNLTQISEGASVLGIVIREINGTIQSTIL